MIFFTSIFNVLCNLFFLFLVKGEKVRVSKYLMGFIAFAVFFTQVSVAEKVKALSRFDKPIFGETEVKFNFVNQDAPKGGKLNLSTVGTFDTLNWLSIKGTAVYGSLITFCPLMTRSPCEPFGLYGVLAEYVDLEKDNSAITFYLDSKAKFHDGTQFTAHDVKFTVDLLCEKGPPRYKKFFSKVKSVDVLDDHTIRFVFLKEENGTYDPELPLIIALIRPLSKKQLENVDFNTGMTILNGTGPYKISSFEQGRFVVYERDKNFWGNHIPYLQGMYNFDTIKIDYFKNVQSQFQAFLAGETSIYFETEPTRWVNAYDVSPVKQGKIKKVDFEHSRPVMVRTIIFNMRKEIFSDIKVRQAISKVFDFDNLNKVAMAGAMICPNSLFANTVLAHQGSASAGELEILKKFEDKISKDFFDTMVGSAFVPSSNNNDEEKRENIKKANELLDQAGWKIVDGTRMKGGKPLVLEFLLKDPNVQKIAISFREDLKKIGVELNIKMMDSAQYENLVTEREFDMIAHSWANSLSPGIEQSYYFGAAYADVKGSSNWMGIKDKIAEDLASMIPLAKNTEELVDRVRAFDRYVIHNYWMIPVACLNRDRWAYWVDQVAYPEVDKNVGLNVIEWGWTPKVENGSDHSGDNSVTNDGWFKNVYRKISSLWS